VWRLFYDTIKGGDYRAREANVYRLAELSMAIIDQCVAQGVPFAREYGGTLANRSFGGAQVSRTFYAQGQTGQQLLLGAYGALMRQVDAGRVALYPRREMLEVVVAGGKARGIVCRNLVTGQLESYAGDAVVLATGGYANVFYLSTNARNSNATALWRCHRRGALLANPCYTQIHPTCIPVSGDHQSKLTLMSESLRNDGRVWVPKKEDDTRAPHQIPEAERDYYLERKYPTFGNLVPRDVASRNAKEVCDEGRGVGSSHRAVYLDFSERIEQEGVEAIRGKYGNLFEMYERITGENPYEAPMRIYPASHYVMGGLWVDYNLMSSIPGLFVLGEANFSDHGANRLGASSLMQTLADGYFVIPYTLGHYLANTTLERVGVEHAAFSEMQHEADTRLEQLLAVQGDKTAIEFYRELGLIMWDKVGMSRNAAGLQQALVSIDKLEREFEHNVKVSGVANGFNKDLEMAGRVADFFELGKLVAQDALQREESCGAHFREEHQTSEGEALRHDEAFSFVAAWAYKGKNAESELHKEQLDFEWVTPSTRSYK